MRIGNSNVFHVAAILALLLVLTYPAHAADVTVSNGWFRALPPSVPSGGYFTLHNGGKTTAILTDVESPACAAMMMHQTTASGMDHVMALDIRAGEDMVFAPGGYHLMLMELNAQVREGDKVPLTLGFEDKAGKRFTVDVQATARALTTAMPHSKH